MLSRAKESIFCIFRFFRVIKNTYHPREQNHAYLSNSSSHRLKRKEKECPTGIHCGTSVPGFMIGRHPQIKGTVRTRKVCFSKGGNCCAYKVTIKVKRCPDRVLVYQLPKAPIGNSRYCSFAST